MSSVHLLTHNSPQTAQTEQFTIPLSGERWLFPFNWHGDNDEGGNRLGSELVRGGTRGGEVWRDEATAGDRWRYLAKDSERCPEVSRGTCQEKRRDRQRWKSEFLGAPGLCCLECGVENAVSNWASRLEDALKIFSKCRKLVTRDTSIYSCNQTLRPWEVVGLNKEYFLISSIP